jgi:hypothetical protein
MKHLVWRVALIVIATVGGAAADEWKFYRYPKEGFAIEFPGEPKPQPQQVDPKKIVQSSQYWLDLGAVAYGIDATQFLHNIIASQDAARLLQSSIEGVRGSLQCTIRSQRPIEMPGSVGREVIFDKCEKIAGLVAKERFFLRGDWLYQIMMLGTKSGIEDDAGTKRFLESFAMIAM